MERAFWITKTGNKSQTRGTKNQVQNILETQLLDKNYRFLNL
jgi:hypothetical protein